MKNIKKINIISLGGGRQSSFMLIKALEGYFDFKPDYAVFADTQSEPKYVILQLQALSSYVLKNFNFKINIVTSGNLIQDTINYCSKEKKNSISLPLWTAPNGAPMHRQCTDYYKIRAIRRFIRSTVGKVPVRLWIGISLDEMERIKLSSVSYIENYYPLVHYRIKIDEILNYFSSHSTLKFSKSSCSVCPYHSDSFWQRFKLQFPNEFDDVCRFDDTIRHVPNYNFESYLHRSLLPLRDIDFSFKPSLFPELIEDCSGMCGL